MKHMFNTILILMLALALMPACDSKKGEGKEEAAGEEGPNPFQIRKDSVEAYMTAIEGAADADAALAAGQAWLDANLDGYKKNCDMLIEYRGDAKKSKMAKGIETDFDGYMTRLSEKAGGPMAVGPLGAQFNSFFNCDVLKKQ